MYQASVRVWERERSPVLVRKDVLRSIMSVVFVKDGSGLTSDVSVKTCSAQRTRRTLARWSGSILTLILFAISAAFNPTFWSTLLSVHMVSNNHMSERETHQRGRWRSRALQRRQSRRGWRRCRDPVSSSGVFPVQFDAVTHFYRGGVVRRLDERRDGTERRDGDLPRLV